MEEKDSRAGLSRREFFKAAGIAGLAAGVAGTGSLVKAVPAYASNDAASAILDFAITETDVPPYKKKPYEGAEKLARYHEANQAFNNRDLMMQEFGGKPWAVAQMPAVIKRARDKVPGFTLPDQVISSVTWTSYRGGGGALFSWEPLGVANLALLQELGKWQGSPDENNRIIKKVAYTFGAGAAGIAAVNEQWFYSHDSKGLPIIFSDAYDKPTITKDAKFIPKRMNRIIVLLVPMEGALAKYSPSALGAGSWGMGYSLMAEVASKMAEFIRGMGYNAIPMGNDTCLSVPVAIDAGLGEMGRHGLLINPELGSLLRIAKVLTDMPITPDKPIEFGAAEFCRTCMKCAKNCPSRSISMSKDPSYDTFCKSNNPGMKKWYVNTWSCLKFWVENGSSCGNCQIVCPYSKPKTWIHDVVKGISSKTTAFNSAFITLDDALGYGKTLEENDPRKWWSSKGRPERWPR
ncbi:reductive dehalogenase [Moorella sulfitireducens (nom. illeg.)]|uniref:reductive dehalogenase n=1 Tax=Neomoorella sulfitireducens TaxID=2972948 RepID=UPI0021ABC2CB|nr:reductive dehalogenase [Moorella sulfitireducens]